MTVSRARHKARHSTLGVAEFFPKDTTPKALTLLQPALDLTSRSHAVDYKFPHSSSPPLATLPSHLLPFIRYKRQLNRDRSAPE